MPFQPVPDGIEIVLDATQNTVPVVNVFNVKDTSTHDATLLEAYANAVLTWWQTNVAPELHQSYVLNAVKVTSLELSTGPQFILPVTSSNTGALTGDPVAANAALVISWRTASIGRSFRGRTYQGGMDTVALATAQEVTTGFVSAMALNYANLIDAITAVGGALSVLSRFALGVARVAGLLTEITGIIIDTKVDSQRRRTAN